MPTNFTDIKLAFSIYQSEPNKMDGFYLGNVLRGLNVNPSLQQLEEMGGQKKTENPDSDLKFTIKGVKTIALEDVFAIYADVKKNLNEYGCYEDFIELLKLSDKNQNGKMQLSELSAFLLTLGEKLTDAEVDELYKNCMPEENDDGQIEYTTFLKAMCMKADM